MQLNSRVWFLLLVSMLNVFTELDNLSGDGKDVFGPAVSVGLGEKWPNHSRVSAPLKDPW